MTRFQFPKGFFWGAATSAHQVEGGNRNDWTEWEIENAKIKMQNAKLREWPDYILKNYPNPLQEENYISGRACDHYNRFREDFDIAKSLGHNAHRFSIEWSRIEPEEGKFNEAEIEHYREVIRALRERGMEPFVTLWHYTLPRWFVVRGGWLAADAPKLFTRYAERVAAEFRNQVKFWITENEPETFARHGFLTGDRPPGKRNIWQAYRVLKNLLSAHLLAREAIHILRSDAQVGIAETQVFFEPFGKSPVNRLVLRIIKWWRNNPFIRHFIANSDFFGLEYYFHTRVRFNPFVSRWGIQYNENKAVSDMGWELYPQGIEPLLVELNLFRKPIYILEHGLADAKDSRRAWYIRESLKQVGGALSLGLDIRGYFHWSLLDNFELNLGFWPRFGLVEVDYKTMERKIRPSAWAYKEIIEKGLPA